MGTTLQIRPGVLAGGVVLALLRNARQGAPVMGAGWQTLMGLFLGLLAALGARYRTRASTCLPPAAAAPSAPACSGHDVRVVSERVFSCTYGAHY
jgi:hypothetical protein